jgi:hypothetical protein
MRQRTVLALAKLADGCFAYSSYPSTGMHRVHRERLDWLYDLLFAHQFPRRILDDLSRQTPDQPGVIKYFILGLWQNWQDYVGPRYSGDEGGGIELFEKLAAALLEYVHGSEMHMAIGTSARDAAMRELELDGYRWSHGRLVRDEVNVFDVADQEGALVELYRALGLDDLEQVKHDLKLTDDYSAGKWGDCVKHARDVLEKTLFHVASAWLADKGGLADKRPVTVRDRLLATQFLTKREHGLIRELYGLLSEDGGHPNMATKESARIDRQHALTAVHFVLLRLEARRAPGVT